MWSTFEDEIECVKTVNPDISIKCPKNTTIILKANQNDVFVQLENPKSNVRSSRIKVFPRWAQSLRVHLEAGVHKINFRAYSDNFTRYASCTTTITVRLAEPPKILFCPQSFEVALDKNEIGKSVFWDEPQFSRNNTLTSIQKSKVSIDLLKKKK